jgi:hypothetical protein
MLSRANALAVISNPAKTLMVGSAIFNLFTRNSRKAVNIFKRSNGCSQ